MPRSREPAPEDSEEVDHTLLAWFSALTLRQRLDAASDAANALARLRRSDVADEG